jgi:hypothetical protein
MKTSRGTMVTNAKPIVPVEVEEMEQWERGDDHAQH